MEKVKIGVMGAYRGTSMINYCEQADNAQVVAICDKWVEGLERQKAALNDPEIVYYTDFEDFIRHDMDAVVLANYATEHAPFAIRAMKAGKHVFSEVLPAQTMREAVELTVRSASNRGSHATNSSPHFWAVSCARTSTLLESLER